LFLFRLHDLSIGLSSQTDSRSGLLLYHGSSNSLPLEFHSSEEFTRISASLHGNLAPPILRPSSLSYCFFSKIAPFIIFFQGKRLPSFRGAGLTRERIPSDRRLFTPHPAPFPPSLLVLSPLSSPGFSPFLPEAIPVFSRCVCPGF